MDDDRTSTEEYEFDDDDDELGDLDGSTLGPEDEHEDEEDEDEDEDEDENDEDEDEDDEEEDDEDEENDNLVQNGQGGYAPRRVQNTEVDNTRRLGLNQDRNAARVGDNLLPNNEDGGSPWRLSGPSSPLDSPGSVSSTNVREERERASDLLMSVSMSANVHQNKIKELAFGAMDELLKMASNGEPLWQPRTFDRPNEVLNGFEYLRMFGTIDSTFEKIIKLVEVGDPNACDLSFDMPYGVEPKPKSPGVDPLRIEASRDCVFVQMNATTIVDLLMDLKQWAMTFISIISRVTLLGVLSRGTGYRNYDGMLQVISSEFNMPTMLVPPRECQFARYCRQLDHGTWAVADISLETLFPYPIVLFRKRPSGCIIQELPQIQCSKVIWVEHVEADNSSIHGLFAPLVTSGFAFSATRWLSCITRYSEELFVLLSRSNSTLDGRKTSMLRVADKMMKLFCRDINASSENPWLPLPIVGGEDIKYMSRVLVLGSGRSITSTITFSTSIYLPCSPKKTFDFLRDENLRPKWDMLSFGLTVREIAFVSGTNPLNRVSVLQTSSATKGVSVLHLQKTYKNETGSYVIYAPVDTLSMSMILNGGNPDNLAVLPSGFVILPDRLSMYNENVGGTILTVTFHIIDNSSMLGYITLQKVDTIRAIISKTIYFIRDALTSSNTPDPAPAPSPPHSLHFQHFQKNRFPGESSSTPGLPSNLWNPRK